MYKVALIHNIISPYRVPLFEGLSNHPLVDLFVYFCAKTHKQRKWDILESKNYKYDILPGITLEFLDITYHVNPSVLSKLLVRKYNAVILGGNPDFTVHFSFFICKLLQIPIIWWSEAIESSQTKLGKLISPLTKYIVKNADSIVVPSTLSRDFHMKLGATSNKIFIAHNIVDNEMFAKKSETFRTNKENLKIEIGMQNKKIILFVGQLIERKGIEYLIKAYKDLKKEYDDICLIIIGDGPLKENLKLMSTKYNISDIFFKGWVSENEKIFYYSISDLFVLPTLGDLCPLVINEAMACSLPIISTTAAGNSQDMILSGENGYTVCPKDIDQLYKGIKEIIVNDELRNAMSKKSFSIVQKEYSIENTVDGFVSAISYSLQRSTLHSMS